ncbi:hypothetical protein GF352_01115 [archaeon]|nr:hypothetical protein [archaeon]
MSKVSLRKTKNPQLNKALGEIEETLNSIDDKLNDLRELDKGSKFFAVIGWLMMGLGGGGLLTIAVLFKDSIMGFLSYVWVFIVSTILVTVMISGFALAHKGLTGDWL